MKSFDIAAVGGALLISVIALTGNAQAETPKELAGRWAKLTRLESLSKVPVIGEVSLQTEVISLMDLAPDGKGGLREAS